MWDRLSMIDRARYINLAVQNGVTDIGNIRETYNFYKEGGKKVGPTYNKQEKRWYGPDGKIIPYGRGYWSKAIQKYVMYGSDGSVTKYDPLSWARKKDADIVRHRKELEKKHAISYDNPIRITQNNRGGKDSNKDRGALVSQAQVDSTLKYTNLVGLPIEHGLGLAAQESTFNNNLDESRGPGMYYGSPTSGNRWTPEVTNDNKVSPVLMTSDWSYINDNPYRDYIATIEKLPEKEREQAALDGRRDMENKAKKFNINEPPLLHAMKKFKSGKYNPGDPNHTSDVIARGKNLMTSPEMLNMINHSSFNKTYDTGGNLNFPIPSLDEVVEWNMQQNPQILPEANLDTAPLYEAYNEAHPIELPTLTVQGKRPESSYQKAARALGESVKKVLGPNYESLIGPSRVANVNRHLGNPVFEPLNSLGSNVMEFQGPASVGLLNRMMPSQNIGFIRDLFSGKSGDELAQSFIMGNSGLVTEQYAQENPKTALGINLLGDVLFSYGLNKAVPTIKKGVKTTIKEINDLKDTYQYAKTRDLDTLQEYKDAMIDLAMKYIQKYGTPKNTTAGRIRGLAEELRNRDLEMKQVYLRDPEFKQFIEEGNMEQYFREAPEYAYFCYKEGLDPSLKETAAAFIKRQETSIRGVHDVPDDQIENSLTFSKNTKSSDKRGGDNLGTQGGLYTSNSGSLTGQSQAPSISNPEEMIDKIGNRFIKPINHVKEGSYGILAKLHTDFGIDPQLEPLEQIRQFKNKSLFWDVINAPAIEFAPEETPIPRLNLSKNTQYKRMPGGKVAKYSSEINPGYRIKQLDPSIKALVSPYFSPTTLERVLLTSLPEEKVAQIVESQRIPNTSLRTSRWSGVDFDYNDGAFLPYVPSNDFKTLLHYSRLRELGQNKVSNPYVEGLRTAMFDTTAGRIVDWKKLTAKKLDASLKLRNQVRKIKDVTTTAALASIPGSLGYMAYQDYKDRKQAAEAMKDFSDQELAELFNNTSQQSPEYEHIRDAYIYRISNK